MEAIIFFILGALAGGGAAFFFRQKRERELEKEIVALETRRESEIQAAEEKLAELKELRAQFENTFKALSSEALQSNNQAFLNLAKNALEQTLEAGKGDLQRRQQSIEHLVGPIRESLQKVDGKLQDIEKTRAESQGALQEQLKNLLASNRLLQKEAGNLAGALRRPGVRGSWGEMQLRRAVEFAGMLDHCDFIRQESGPEGRPDMIINLPNSRRVIVDAKTPMEAFLQALETDDPERRHELFARHARHLRARIKELSGKKYWEQFSSTPEMVLLFLPNEALFSAALEQDPALLEFGAKNSVIPATPTTLMALLFAVAHGWRQQQAAEHVGAIRDLGRELYERIRQFTGHMADLGQRLRQGADAYNKAVSSLERRLLPGARKFRELGAGGKAEIPPPPSVSGPLQPPSRDGDSP